MRGAAPDETVVRSTAAAATAAEPVEAAPTRRRGALVAIVVAAVLVVGGGAAALSAALGGGASAEPATIAQPDDDDELDDIVGTTVATPVLVSREVQPDGTIAFAWSAAEGSAADAFRWEQISGGDAVSAPDPATTAVLPASTTGAPVCIQIWAIEQGAQSVSPLEACAP